MLLAVIVEDDDKAAAELEAYIDRYAASCGEKIRTVRYGDAESFLVGYKTGVDIVFMDIELPDMDGMAAAAKLRERDSLVTIVFVTNMAQFAVKGYSVGAFDFLVKPVTYYGFATMMNRAAAVIHSNKVPEMTVRSSDGLRRVELANVQYIEVLGHKLIYHTDGGDIDGWGSLNDMEQRLAPYHFVRGSNCYLINLRHVTAIDGSIATVSGHELALSRTRRRDFIRALNEYLGDR